MTCCLQFVRRLIAYKEGSRMVVVPSGFDSFLIDFRELRKFITFNHRTSSVLQMTQC